MPYMIETCEAGVTYEVHKYHSWRCPGKGGRRGKRENLTSEAQWKVNMRKASKELRRLMNANFRDGDMLVRLDFAKAGAPQGSAQMQETMGAFLRKLRREYKKQGVVLKYIYVKEVGPRGGRHIHALFPACQDVLGVLRRCWTYGGIHIDPLNSGGQYRKIAEYFVKYAGRTEETEGKLIGKRWYPSRNLTRPNVCRRVLAARTFRKEVKGKAGYILEKDSVRYGISEYSGYEYFSYTLLRVGGSGNGKAPGGGSRKKRGKPARKNARGEGGGRKPDRKSRSCTSATTPDHAGWQGQPGQQDQQSRQSQQKQRKRGNQPCLKNSGNSVPRRK